MERDPGKLDLNGATSYLVTYLAKLGHKLVFIKARQLAG